MGLHHVFNENFDYVGKYNVSSFNCQKTFLWYYNCWIKPHFKFDIRISITSWNHLNFSFYPTFVCLSRYIYIYILTTIFSRDYPPIYITHLHTIFPYIEGKSHYKDKIHISCTPGHIRSASGVWIWLIPYKLWDNFFMMSQRAYWLA